MCSTVLELAGLPMPEVLQGQSLAPLLLGRPGYTPRPIIFDDFGTDNRTGELERVHRSDRRPVGRIARDPRSERHSGPAAVAAAALRCLERPDGAENVERRAARTW